MKLRLVVFIGILSVMSLSLSAQSSWREGYVIELNGDTTKSIIKSTFGKNRFEKCLVRRGSEVLEYNSNQISGYGFYNGKGYSAQIVESSFVEILILGDVSLFRKGSDYFVQKESNDVLELSEGTIEYASDNGYKRKNKQWKGLLFDYLSDCNILLEEVQDASLNESDLSGLVRRYNLCKGSDYTDFKKNIPRLSVGYGISAGIRSSTLEVSNGQSLTFLGFDYESKDSFFGIYASFSFPRLSERTRFETELRYTSSRYTNLVTRTSVGSIVERYEPIHDIDLVQLPLSVKYYIIKGQLSLFIQPGVTISFVANSSSRILYDRITQSNIVTEDREYLDFLQSFFVPTGRIGFTYQLKNIELGINAELFAPISNFVVGIEPGYISSLKQSSIGIQIGLK